MDLAFKPKELLASSTAGVTDVVCIRRAVSIQVAYALAFFIAGFAYACDESDQNRGTVVILTQVEEVAVGEDHSCALRHDGSVVCWGHNAKGQLGSKPEKSEFEALDPVGITTERASGYSRDASAVDGLSGVRHIAAGAYHTCAIVNDGSVWCWGDAAAGQLGNGDFSMDDCEGRPCSRKPVQAVGIEDAVDLSLGYQHSCARLADGTLRCWGTNAIGQRPELLDSCDRFACATSPIDVPFEDEVLDVRAGALHTCTLLTGGSVFCWGTNAVGQVGISNPPMRSVDGVDVLRAVDQPSQVNLPEPIDQFAAANSFVAWSEKSCARGVSGSYYCWGSDDYGELGIGADETESCWMSFGGSRPCAREPRRVALDAEIEIEKFVMTNDTGCAVSRDDRLYCWGRAGSAQLGREAEVEDSCVSNERCSRSPIEISTDERILDIAIGSRYTCALQPDDQIACWGWEYPQQVEGSFKRIDCSSSLDPCDVEKSWTDRPRELFFNHFDTFCVLTQAGEIHCLDDLIYDSHSIESEPMKVYP